MIIAMVAMLMMQTPLDKVIDMVAMRHSFVTAARTMDVTGLMSLMTVLWGAAVWIYVGHLNHVNPGVVAVRIVKLAITEVVDVVSVSDSYMTASWAVLVRKLRSSHGITLL